MSFNSGERMQPAKKGAELLAYIASLLTNALQKLGIAEMPAKHGAEAIVRDLADALGGQVVYFPKDSVRKAAEKHAAVVAEFTGQNHAALAVRHGLGVHQVYRILANDVSKRRANLRVNGTTQAATEKEE